MDLTLKVRSMNLYKFRIAKAIALLTFLPLFAGQTFSQTTEFSGRIADENSGAIPRVKVRMQRSGGEEFTALTDENGEFTVKLPEGKYDLHFDAVKGFADLTVYNFIVDASSSGDGKNNWTLNVDSEGTIVSEFVCGETRRKGCDYVSQLIKSDSLTLTGKVRDRRKRALSNVKIRACNSEGRLFETATNLKGKFRLVLPLGIYDFELQKNGFDLLKVSNVEASPGTDIWEVTIDRTQK